MSDIKKLPIWAQKEIERLNQDLDHAKKQLQEISGKGATNTFLSDLMDEMPLPNNSIIHFYLSEKNKITARITKEGFLNINCSSRISCEAVIKPIAANCFEVKFIKD